VLPPSRPHSANAKPLRRSNEREAGCQRLSDIEMALLPFQDKQAADQVPWVHRHVRSGTGADETFGAKAKNSDAASAFDRRRNNAKRAAWCGKAAIFILLLFTFTWSFWIAVTAGSGRLPLADPSSSSSTSRRMAAAAPESTPREDLAKTGGTAVGVAHAITDFLLHLVGLA